MPASAPPRASPPRRLADTPAAEALFAPLARQPREVAAFAYLGADGTLLGLRHAPSPSADQVAVSIRDVVADALAFGAAGVLIAHNHPSGRAEFSEADRALTGRLARTLDALGVRFVGHLVVPGR